MIQAIVAVMAGVTGAAVGAYVGARRSCAGSSCPLTLNWRRGAVSGLIVGALAGAGASWLAPPAPANLPAFAPDGPVSPIATPEQFNQAVEAAPGRELVYFYAEWCSVCRQVKPEVLAAAFVSGIHKGTPVLAVNVDALPEVARKYQVMLLPTFVAFEGGKEVARRSGTADRKELLSILAAPKQVAAGAQDAASPLTGRPHLPG